jgi:predicted metallo-beta-lactamase superfamily hydrolase
MIEKALANGLRLAKRVDRLIIDHHLLRSATGLKWLERLIEESRGRVVAAADWQGRVLQLLEAQRRHLFSSS